MCPNCGGNGEVISEYCRKCSGEGCIRVKKNIKVKVPPGVSPGSILRVVGEGDAGPRGYVNAAHIWRRNVIFISFIYVYMYTHLLVYLG